MRLANIVESRLFLDKLCECRETYVAESVSVLVLVLVIVALSTSVLVILSDEISKCRMQIVLETWGIVAGTHVAESVSVFVIVALSTSVLVIVALSTSVLVILINEISKCL
jgi:hypothetical protein